jgi:hypothetical protein
MRTAFWCTTLAQKDSNDSLEPRNGRKYEDVGGLEDKRTHRCRGNIAGAALSDLPVRYRTSQSNVLAIRWERAI